MPYIGNPIYQSAFVTDQFSGDGTTTAFTMAVAPAGTSNVLAIISGVVQDPSTYGVVGNTITFSAAPPSGTGNISCRYLGVPATGVVTTAYRTVTEFTATAGQTTFTPPSYNVGFINVYRNGVLLGSADYTATNGTTVVLATGATAGDLVTVESFRIESVANAIPNAAGAVSASNLAGGAALSNIGAGGITQSYLASGVATTGPIFSAYIGSGQSVSAGVATKVAYDTVEFDTASCYNNTTYRFTPNVAGYYQFSFAIGCGNVSNRYTAYLYKNGSIYKQGNDGIGNGTNSMGSAGAAIAYANGSTDYFEIYVQGNNATTIGNGVVQAFQGFLARKA